MKETTVCNGESKERNELRCQNLGGGEDFEKEVNLEWTESEWFNDWLELANSSQKDGA